MKTKGFYDLTKTGWWNIQIYYPIIIIKNRELAIDLQTIFVLNWSPTRVIGFKFFSFGAAITWQSQQMQNASSVTKK